MRDSEVKHLRRGCLTTESAGDERLVRHKVTSLTFKSEHAAGAEATWVVGAPVAREIQVLEQLQPAQQDLLFAPLSTAAHRHKPRTNEVLSSRASNDDISGFIAWVNNYCANRGLAGSVPDIGDHPPTVTTRQFRRTLA